MVVTNGGASKAGRLAILKWALMVVALFWVVVYRAAREGEGVPEFLYVNF